MRALIVAAIAAGILALSHSTQAQEGTSVAMKASTPVPQVHPFMPFADYKAVVTARVHAPPKYGARTGIRFEQPADLVQNGTGIIQPAALGIEENTLVARGRTIRNAPRSDQSQ